MNTRGVAVMAALAVVAAGCGGGEVSKTGSEQTAGDPRPVRIAVIMASLGNDFYLAQKEGAEAAAGGENGATVEVSAGRAQGSTDEVVGLIENAIAKRVDAIAVNGSDTKPLCRCCEECSTPRFRSCSSTRPRTR